MPNESGGGARSRRSRSPDDDRRRRGGSPDDKGFVARLRVSLSAIVDTMEQKKQPAGAAAGTTAGARAADGAGAPAATPGARSGRSEHWYRLRGPDGEEAGRIKVAFTWAPGGEDEADDVSVSPPAGDGRGRGGYGGAKGERGAKAEKKRVGGGKPAVVSSTTSDDSSSDGRAQPRGRRGPDEPVSSSAVAALLDVQALRARAHKAGATRSALVRAAAVYDADGAGWVSLKHAGTVLEDAGIALAKPQLRAAAAAAAHASAPQRVDYRTLAAIACGGEGDDAVAAELAARVRTAVAAAVGAGTNVGSVFAAFDRGGRGRLHIRDAAEAFGALGCPCAPAAAAAALDAIGVVVDARGTVEIAALLRALPNGGAGAGGGVEALTPAERLLRLRVRESAWVMNHIDMRRPFHEFDTRGSGKLTHREFQDAVARMGVIMSAAEVCVRVCIVLCLLVCRARACGGGTGETHVVCWGGRRSQRSLGGSTQTATDW